MGFFDKVKDVADTIVDSVEKGAKNVSDTSKKTADKMRIKKEISKVAGEINRAYAEIGKKYFELHADNPEEVYAESITTILSNNMKLNELNTELHQLSNKFVCPSCNGTVSDTDKFCASCGAQLNFPKPQTEEKEPVEVTPEESVEQDEAEKTEEVVEAEIVIDEKDEEK